MKIININNIYLGEYYLSGDNYDRQNRILTLKYSDDFYAINQLTDYCMYGKYQDIFIKEKKNNVIYHITDLKILKYAKEMIPDKEDYYMKFTFLYLKWNTISENEQIYKKIIRLNKIDKLLKENV